MRRHHRGAQQKYDTPDCQWGCEVIGDWVLKSWLTCKRGWAHGEWCFLDHSTALNHALWVSNKQIKPGHRAWLVVIRNHHLCACGWAHFLVEPLRTTALQRRSACETSASMKGRQTQAESRNTRLAGKVALQVCTSADSVWKANYNKLMGDTVQQLLAQCELNHGMLKHGTSANNKKCLGTAYV